MHLLAVCAAARLGINPMPRKCRPAIANTNISVLFNQGDAHQIAKSALIFWPLSALRLSEYVVLCPPFSSVLF